MKREIEVLVYSPCYDHKEAPLVWRVLGAAAAWNKDHCLPKMLRTGQHRLSGSLSSARN